MKCNNQIYQIRIFRQTCYAHFTCSVRGETGFIACRQTGLKHGRRLAQLILNFLVSLFYLLKLDFKLFLFRCRYVLISVRMVF